MKKYFEITCILLLAFIMTGAASPEFESATKSAQDKNYNKQFNVKPGGSVTLDLHTGASIEISGWNKQTLSANVEVGGKDAEEVDFKFSQSGDDVEITSEYLNKNENHSARIKVVLNVPDKFNVDFTTMGGGVTLANIDGTLEGTTMGGKLDLSGLKGTLKMKTMGGRITLKDSEVDGKVETMGGEVLVENVIGDVDAKSMGGKVQHINVKGKGKNIGKEVNITTMGGELDVDEAPNGAKLKTMGGDITINSANLFVDAETMGGEIEIKKVDGWVKAKTMGGDVYVNLTGDPDADKKDVTLSSMGGDITLNVPDNFSMDVNIEIAYTKKGNNSKSEIVSDFNVKEERTKEWDDSKGSPRKYIYGTGSFSGGKNKVTIKTVNGTVYLRKAK